jgi:hypothetical protein
LELPKKHYERELYHALSSWSIFSKITLLFILRRILKIGYVFTGSFQLTGDHILLILISLNICGMLSRGTLRNYTPEIII